MLHGIINNSMKRLDFNAETIEAAENYIYNRAIQLLKFNVVLRGIVVREQGVIAVFGYENEIYHSFYILKQYRGQGWYTTFYKEFKGTILTSSECQMEVYLQVKGIPYKTFTIEDSNEYKVIQNFYGDGKAKRSGQYFMNHIDEGLAILNLIGASDEAKRAYCLHPIFQADADLIKAIPVRFELTDNAVLINVMEYRSVANEYLSTRNINSIDDIRLSPLKDVNDMLVADKVQNKKDFDLYHLDTHPRSVELDWYFRCWLKRLNVTAANMSYFRRKITVKTNQYV